MKNQNRCIYIMLTDTGSWLNRLVKRYTEAPYNHASIGLDEELNHLYSFGRKKPRNPFYGGFIKEDVAVGTYRRFPNTTCVIYRMPVTEKQYRKIKSIIRNFERTKYIYSFNFIGLFAVAMDKPLKRKTAYFCSEFVAEVLRRGGVEVFQKDSSLVRPDDFQNLPGVTLVYEGKLYEYEKVVDKVGSPFEDIRYSRFHFFIKPVKKTVQFVNPMFYYQYAFERAKNKDKE